MSRSVIRAYSPEETVGVARYGPLVVAAFWVLGMVYFYNRFPELSPVTKAVIVLAATAGFIIWNREDYGMYRNAFARLIGGEGEITVGKDGVAVRRRVLSRQYSWGDVQRIVVTITEPDMGERCVTLDLSDGRAVQFDDGETLNHLRQVEQWASSSLDGIEKMVFRFFIESGKLEEVHEAHGIGAYIQPVQRTKG